MGEASNENDSYPSKPSSNHEGSSSNIATDNSRATKGRWTAEEHQRFIDALRAFGKDWY